MQDLDVWQTLEPIIQYQLAMTAGRARRGLADVDSCLGRTQSFESQIRDAITDMKTARTVMIARQRSLRQLPESDPSRVAGLKETDQLIQYADKQLAAAYSRRDNQRSPAPREEKTAAVARLQHLDATAD